MKQIIFFTKLIFTLPIAIILLSLKCSSDNNQNAVKPVIRVSSFLSEQDFNALFPKRNKFYSYAAFIEAIKEMNCISVKVIRRGVSVYQFTRTDKSTAKSTIVRQDSDWNETWAKKKPDSSYVIDYSNFCSKENLITDEKELAAFFANIAHETRHGENEKYNDGLMLIHESNTSLSYITDNDAYPAVAGKKYYGRGPIQLSYNGNYGYASDCIFGNKKTLLNNPELVETDPIVAFKTAIYFWMTPQTYKPSAHDVICAKWQPNAADKAAGRTPGFGMVINIINGEVECGKGEKVYSMNDRIGFYRFFLNRFKLNDINCACSCGKMKAY